MFGQTPTTYGASPTALRTMAQPQMRSMAPTTYAAPQQVMQQPRIMTQQVVPQMQQAYVQPQVVQAPQVETTY